MACITMTPQYSIPTFSEYFFGPSQSSTETMHYSNIQWILISEFLIEEMTHIWYKKFFYHSELVPQFSLRKQ
jgi:hypothetical protein